MRQALETTTDFSFNYAQPGFYALVEHLKRSGLSPGHAREPVDVPDWAVLLERPADFRGLPITIEGVVARNTAWRHVGEQHRELGTLWELQIRRDDQPILCRAVLTADAGDLQIGARVTLAGYFLMIQQFYSESKQLRQAAVLVATGPTRVTLTQRRPLTAQPVKWTGVLVALTAGLIVAWLLLRRRSAAAQSRSRELRAEHAAPLNLSAELSAWADSAKSDDDRKT